MALDALHAIPAQTDRGTPPTHNISVLNNLQKSGTPFPHPRSPAIYFPLLCDYMVLPSSSPAPFVLTVHKLLQFYLHCGEMSRNILDFIHPVAFCVLKRHLIANLIFYDRYKRSICHIHIKNIILPDKTDIIVAVAPKHHFPLTLLLLSAAALTIPFVFNSSM